ncbi:MAG: hypothetical protein ACXVDL_15800, partial [Bacteroidia bacterium]
VKNPHFAVLSPYLLKKWPNSRLLVCFRDPASAIASASYKVTPLINEDTYLLYYNELLKLPDDKVIFLSYDRLITSAGRSVFTLAEKLKLKGDKVKEAVELIKAPLHNYDVQQTTGNKAVKELYELMLSRAIN